MTPTSDDPLDKIIQAHAETAEAGAAVSATAEAEPSVRDVQLGDELTAHQRGQYLAARFIDRKYVPVLVFGARASGKTSLLTSLFQFMHVSQGANATLTLDIDVIPDDSISWQKMRKYATVLFERKVHDFMDNKAAPATLDDLPFFVPVVLQSNSGPDQRFAFLEGRGEWYMPTSQGDSPHQPFRGEVEGMLRHFNKPLSVIYVAPYTTHGYSDSGQVEVPNSEEMKARDLGLLGTLRQYRDLRKANYHHDSHLFLFSKWDVRCDGIADPDFVMPSSELLELEISQRYPLSFARFQNMQLGHSGAQKAASHYCSGVIDGRAVLAPASSDRAKLDYFPRRIWNWLYFNAQHEPLYPDVQPKPPSILDKLLKMLRG